MLSPVAATNEALHAQLSDLRRDLQRAQGTAAQLPQETARADEAEAKCRCLEADAATASGQMSKLEDKLLSTEQRLQEAQGVFKAAPDRTCCALLCYAVHAACCGLHRCVYMCVCLSVCLLVCLSVESIWLRLQSPITTLHYKVVGTCPNWQKRLSVQHALTVPKQDA